MQAEPLFTSTHKKISNQIASVSSIIQQGDYEFKHQEFRDTIAEVNETDLVYCDPPHTSGYMLITSPHGLKNNYVFFAVW